MNGLAAGIFLFMAILFLGIASMTGSILAWAFVAFNAILFAGNLTIHMNKEQEARQK